MNKRPDDGHSTQVMDLIRSNDLFAVDSLFRPKRKCAFSAGKKRLCNATYLQKNAKRRPKKLDYFFVSNRWKSCVLSSSTNWAPAVHRFGKFFDHCLLQTIWKWRVKIEKNEPAKDFKAMDEAKWAELNGAIADSLGSNRSPENDQDIDGHLSHMNRSIKQAINRQVRAK